MPDLPNKYQVLRDLSTQFEDEIWLMLGAGFRMMPDSLMYLIADNRDLIIQAMENPLANTTAVKGVVVTQTIAKLMYARANGTSDNIIVYFYPEHVGMIDGYARRWILVTVKRLGLDKDNLSDLEMEIRRFLERAPAVIALTAAHE